jgi:hypothetical protein
MNIAKIKKPKPCNFGNRRVNIILCQLQNKASYLNAYLMKDHITYVPQCVCCCHDFENVNFFLRCPKYTQQKKCSTAAISSH